MTSEKGDKKKFEFEDIALKKIQTHFRTNCRAFLLCVWIDRRMLIGCWKVTENYEIFKEVGKDNSCALVAKKNNIPIQTLSNWLKKEKQIYESVASNSSTMKRQRLRGSPYENLDGACHKWLVSARGQNIPISATILKTKALFFAKELGCNDFCASDGWLDQWKKRKNISLRQFQVYFHIFF